MKIFELNNIGIKLLEENNIEDSRIKSKLLLEYLLNMSKIDLIVNNDKEVDDLIKEKYMKYINEMINGRPIQYIINNQEFMKLNFYVDENVLVPQPDTEILVQKAIEIIKNKKDNKLDILDLCTGSGAIGISLKKYIDDITVYVSDISEKALEIAKKNAIKNEVEVQYILSDMFSKMDNLKFDLIVSNPPYIKTDVIKLLSKEVQKEPIIALDGGRDGLDFYRTIRNEAYKYLKDSGIILLEIGFDQKNTVSELFKNDNNYNYENIELFKDLSNIDRVIKIEKS